MKQSWLIIFFAFLALFLSVEKIAKNLTHGLGASAPVYALAAANAFSTESITATLTLTATTDVSGTSSTTTDTVTSAPTDTATALPTATATPAAPTATTPPTNTPTWTPFVVTATPTAQDVFAAATLSAQKTADAETTGTATATPRNMLLATRTPGPIVVTSTPTAENRATAAVMDAQETAIALTTGTPWMVTATPTNTPTPTHVAVRNNSNSKPAPTETPIALALNALTATPTPAATALFPADLQGKILFLADLDNNRRPEAYMMNPDGSDVARLTSMDFYNRANEREAYSTDKRFRAFALREKGGRNLIQLFYDDYTFNSVHQLTQFGAGTAWAPAWSPNGDSIVFVSSESHNDEIWLLQKGQWPATQLTHNKWEWDHHPSWSPDGKQIIFSSNRGTGKNQLWVMDADGNNQHQLISFAFEAWDPVWVKYTDQ